MRCAGAAEAAKRHLKENERKDIIFLSQKIIKQANLIPKILKIANDLRVIFIELNLFGVQEDYG